MAHNKFWGGGNSDASDSDSESSEDEPQQVAASSAQPRSKMTARWANASSSEDEVEQKRTVRSHTDKRFEQLNERIKLMKNHMKIDDFSTLITDYETILKMIEKLSSVVAQNGGPPSQFIKAIAGIEAYCDRCHQEHLEKKQNKGEKLPENKAKAFNTLRAKVRKGNRQYQDELERMKEHPSDFEVDEESEKESEKSDSSDSEEEAQGGDSDAASSGSSGSSSSGSSSSDSSSDSDSDSSSSDSSGSDSDSSSSASDSDGSSSSDSYKSGSAESDEELDEEAAREKKMLRWLISPEKLEERNRIAEEKKVKEDEREEKALKKQKKQGKSGGDAGQGGKADKFDKQARGSKEEGPEDYSPEELMKKVTEVAQQRGRRNFDKKAYMEKLAGLMAHAAKQGPRAQLYIHSCMVSADFDNTGNVNQAMKIDLWNEALIKVNQMLPLLVESHKEMQEQGEEKSRPAADDDEQEDPRSHARQQELFVSFFEKLDNELYKALQNTVDVYGAEYQEILANSSKFLILLMRVLRFFEDTKQTQPLGTVALRLMEQTYYKPDMLNSKVYEAIQSTMDDDEKPFWVWPEDSRRFMSKLCRFAFATGVPRHQRRAALCQAYHLALHNNFQAARDLLQLGNHLQLGNPVEPAAQEADAHTQILYNRVLAQMGLCAFRLGKIQDAHNCLMDFCMHNKARELLAQGLNYSKNVDRTEEQERAERLRQMPYHMHINLEVLETAHHICAMLLEIPNLAMQSIDPTNNKRVISKVLRRTLDQYDKLLFTGPPENHREAVVSAAKALQRGDWFSACGALEDLKIWDHIDPSNPENGKKTKEMIKGKIKTEALRTYLFAYASIYDAFQLNQLAEMFDLEQKTVHSIVSKMMIKEEITAFWDESSKFVLVQHVEPTPLQRLALALAEKGAQAVENNERLVDPKTGAGFKDQRPTQGGRWADSGPAGSRGRFGKGGGGMDRGFDDGKGRKGKGRGKSTMNAAPRNRGWDNARAGALRGTQQRGWGSRPP